MNKEKVDVLFISAPIQFRRGKNFTLKGDDTSTPPIGLMYLATFLNSNGYLCKVLDVGVKALSLGETIHEIKKLNPRVVGISILTPSTITAVPLARKIKEKLPHVLVGCGGIHISVDPDFIKRYPSFDFAVKGEGEEIMLDIMKKLDRGEKIHGVYDGGYIKNIDKIPNPDYGLIDFSEYGYSLDPKGKRHTAIAMITSRGCPFSCIFCSKSETRRFVRFRSVKNIVNEIEQNMHLSKDFTFMDDTMTLNKNNTKNVCREILKRKLRISWIAMTRADCLTSGMAKLMAKSGCREVFIGVESGDERIRNEVIGKHVSNKIILKAVQICRKYGIRTSLFLMLGFPSEGREEIEKTVNFLNYSKADIMGIHLTSPLPGSRLWPLAISEKAIPADLIDQFIAGKLGPDFSSWPNYIQKESSKEYLESARARAIRTSYLNFDFFKRLLLYYLRFPWRIKYDKHLFRTGINILLRGKSLVQFS